MNYAEALTPVALYVRFSSLVEAEESVETQQTALRDYAERNNFRPINHFVDTRGSREEFDWMMAQATSDNPPFRSTATSAVAGSGSGHFHGTTRRPPSGLI